MILAPGRYLTGLMFYGPGRYHQAYYAGRRCVCVYVYMLMCMCFDV